MRKLILALAAVAAGIAVTANAGTSAGSAVAVAHDYCSGGTLYCERCEDLGCTESPTPCDGIPRYFCFHEPCGCCPPDGGGDGGDGEDDPVQPDPGGN